MSTVDIGYRCEELYGSKNRDIYGIMYHEIFELGNTDIFDTLENNKYLDKDFIIHIKVGAQCIINDELITIKGRYSNDARELISDLIDHINEKYNTHLNYGLWLCNSIDDLLKSYDELNNKSDENPITYYIDGYYVGFVMLSDLDKQGKLWGYSNNPIAVNITTIKNGKIDKKYNI